jgi:hypothetical protein
MVQTNFSVGNAGSLTTVLADISNGADAAINTAYTITMTSGVSLTASVSLMAGSSLSLDGTLPFDAPAFAVTGTVVTNLNLTGTVTLDQGVLINPAVSVSNGVTIVAGLFSGSVFGTADDSGDTAINNGTIQSSGAYGAIGLFTGTVQNGWNGPASAVISGVPVGVDLQTSGLVQNGGTIIGSSGTATAVFLGAGTVDNGQIGATAALLSGGATGVDITGAGVINNDGTITGTTSDAVYLGSGLVTNGQIGAVSALIDSGGDGNGVWIGADIGTVTNFGTIIGGGASGVYLQAGGTLTNGALSDSAALISGAYEGVLLGAAGVALNYGTIQADGNDATQAVIGAFLQAGGTIENMTSAAVINGQDWGVIVEGGAGFVTNLGIIETTGLAGLGVDLAAGGTVMNGMTGGSAAIISSALYGVRILSATSGAPAVVVNEGTIESSIGVDFKHGVTAAAGTLTNGGLIESTAGPSGYAVVFGSGTERLVLQSGGAFVGGVLGNDASDSSTTLELAAGTDGTFSGLAGNSGTVTDSAGSFAFSHIATIAVDAGASWAVTSPGTLTTLLNEGTFSVPGASGTLVATAGVENSGEFTVGSGSATVYAPLITDASTEGMWQINSLGTLMVNSPTVESTQAIVFQATNAELVVGQTPDVSGGQITGSVSPGAPSVLPNFKAPIENFQSGDRILFNGLSFGSDTVVANTVTLWSGPSGTGTDLGSLSFLTLAGAPDPTGAALAAGQLCFLAGTLIETASGQTQVERLAVGDMVRTAAGQLRPITWIGVGRVLATRGQRSAATPVIVRKSALGPNVPHADLRVTKGHSFYLDGALIPVEFLVNHRSILWDDRAQEVLLYHIELETHDVLLANGAPAESYRDDGNRWLFQNAKSGRGQPAKPHYAPVLTGGPIVDTVWRRLLDRAGPRPFLPLTTDPDLHLVVDGLRVDATSRTDDVHVYRLREVPETVRIVSRAAVPQELGLARDPRCVGVAVRRVAVRQGSRFGRFVADDKLLADGFHPSEADGSRRWTNGDAALPTSIFAGFNGPVELVIQTAGTTSYVDQGESPSDGAAVAA